MRTDWPALVFIQFIEVLALCEEWNGQIWILSLEPAFIRLCLQNSVRSSLSPKILARKSDGLNHWMLAFYEDDSRHKRIYIAKQYELYRIYAWEILKNRYSTFITFVNTLKMHMMSQKLQRFKRTFARVKISPFSDQLKLSPQLRCL
jgi:hypothetical protein